MCSNSEWDKLWEDVELDDIFKMFKPTGFLRRVRDEGDKLQRTIATGYCGECDIHKEKLEALRSEIHFLENTNCEHQGITVKVVIERFKEILS